jgi:hypothetical protein
MRAAMSQFSTQCPHCQVKMALKHPDLAGKTAKCPACQQAFVVKVLSASTGIAKPSQKKPVSAQPQKAAPQDIDFPVADDEILDAEEVLDEGETDDDWLSALDSLAPKGPQMVRASGAPAPVAGRPKKAKSPAPKRRRSLRDPDGEFPLWLSRLIMIGTGVATGAFCVVVWAAIVARIGIQTDWFAMVVGGMVGGGVRFGASKWDFGWFPAITAALIALVAIIGGKVYGVHTLRKEAAREQIAEQQRTIDMMKHENFPIHLMAVEISDENLAAGGDEPLFPDVGTDPRRLPDMHGKARWAEAEARWEAKPENERAIIRAQIADEITLRSGQEPETLAVNEHTVVLRGLPIHYAEGTRTQVLSVLDFVFAAIALIAAFRIAAGFVDPR